MSKSLLINYSPFRVTKQQINESRSSNGGRLIVSGVLQRAEVKNHNKRVYPKEILMREANRYQEELVKQKRALGELDHPDSPTVNLNNVSHNIIKIWWEGNALMGDVHVLTTPAGKILEELFLNNVQVGISSRGVGSVKEVFSENEGSSSQIQDDFELIAFDFVSNPSTHGAFMSPVNEGKSFENLNYSLTKVHDIVNSIICDIGTTCSCKF